MNIKALEFELSLMKFSPPGTLEYTWDEQYSDMTQGFVFSHNSWPDSFPYFEDPNESKVAGKLGYYLPPDTNHTVSETHTWCVPPSSKRKEAVWLWFQWLNTFDVQKRWALTGGLPVRTDVMRDPEVYKLAYYPKLLESFDHLVQGPKIPQAFEMMDITIQAIIKAAMGEATAAEALRWAAKAQRELVTE